MKPQDNVVKFSEGWLKILIGQVIKAPDGKEWLIGGYQEEQLWFIPINASLLSLGGQYIERGNLSLSN